MAMSLASARASLPLYARRLANNGALLTQRSGRMPPLLSAIPRASFTTSFPLTNKQQQSSSPEPSSKDTTKDGNPELPAFNFESLGISKNMKVFLMVILGVFGTMEGWFYVQWIWRWWKGDSAEKEKVKPDQVAK